MRINKTELNKLTPPEKGYSLYWDDKLSGFGARITSTGVISFIVQKRIKGREKRITLGRFSEITADQARKQAISKMGEIAMGGDPVARKSKEGAQSVTLNEALEDYIKTRKNLKPLTIDDMRRAIKVVFHLWQNKPLLSLTSDRVKRIHADYGVKHSKARANLAMRYLRAIFNFAAEQYKDAESNPVITDNPVTVLSKQKAWFDIKRRRNLIKAGELKPWFDAVINLNNTEVRDYLILVILTGLRRSEAMNLRWEDIDLTHKTLTARDTKNREDHTLPLSDYLANLLTVRIGTFGSGYVFESKRGRMTNLRYALEIVRKESGVQFTIHDLRRTFATIADSLDVPAYAVKALLNHKTGSDVTAGYIVIDVERLRKPMQRITDYFLSAWNVRNSAEVLILKQ